MEQKWPSHLVIVRHGQSERNAAKDAAKAAGRPMINKTGLRDVDTLLTALGEQQAIATGKFLATRWQFDAVFSSPYQRALQTSDAMLKAYAKPPQIVQEERVREIVFGVLDGLTWSGVREKYPEARIWAFGSRAKENIGIVRRAVRAGRMWRCASIVFSAR